MMAKVPHIEDRPTPDMVESHYLNNFISPIIMSMQVWNWLKNQKGVEAADRNIQSAVKEMTYSQYWLQTLSTYESTNEVSDRVKTALSERYTEIKEDVIPKIDSIIEEIKICVGRNRIDQNQLKELIDKLRK